MKIVFLDIDGVLNSTRLVHIEHYARNDECVLMGFFDPEKEGYNHLSIAWDHMCVRLLEGFVKRNEMKIVISSTWRKSYEVEDFKKMFAAYGWENAPVIGKTEFNKALLTGERTIAGRGGEIVRWVNTWNEERPEDPIDAYIIFDDDSDMTEEQKQWNFVRTENEFGLSYDNIKYAHALLRLQELRNELRKDSLRPTDGSGEQPRPTVLLR